MKKSLLLIAALALTGCSWFGGSKAPVVKPAQLKPLKHHDVQASVAWRHGIADANIPYWTGLRPAVIDGKVYVAGPYGLIAGYDIRSGKVLWRARSKTSPEGGVAVTKQQVIFGTRDGHVIALDRATGKQLWKATVSSGVITAPTVGGDVVLARTEDGRLFALSADNGQSLWSYDTTVPRLSLRGNAKPVIYNGAVFVGQDDGRLSSLSLDDGHLLWQSTIAEPEGQSEIERLVDLDATPAVTDQLAFASSYAQTTAAVLSGDGRIVWKRKIASVNALVADNNALYVTDEHGNVWALDSASGTTLWEQKGLHDRGVSGPVIQGRWIVVADGDGYLHWLSRQDGSFRGRIEADGDGIATAPVEAGDWLLTISREGRLSAVHVKH